MNRGLPWLSRIAPRALLAALGVLLAIGAVNLALHLLWCDRRSSTYEYQSAPFLTVNQYWGTWHFPNHDVEHRKACFDVRYRTNEFGMKSAPVRRDATKIALLGDSFIEGYGNGNDTTAASYMEQLIGPRYQVLNFGVSGHFSTIDELVLYDDFAKFFAPKVTILFFLPYNDLEDVLEPRVARFIDRDLHFVYRQVRSFDEITAYLAAQRPPPNPTRAKETSCLSRFFRIAGSALAQRTQMALNLRWDPDAELTRPYAEQEDAGVRRAWSIVEASLARLAGITESQGSTLVVVDIADPYQLDENWLRLSSLKQRASLSADRPNQRLGAICARLGIRFFDMLPQATAYLRQRGLSFPYLSFRCDRHYGSEGQALIANLTVRYLREAGLL